MAVVEGLVKGGDGLVCSVNIRTKNGATNRSGVKKTIQLPTGQMFHQQITALIVVLPNVQDNDWLSGLRSSVPPPEDVGD